MAVFGVITRPRGSQHAFCLEKKLTDRAAALAYAAERGRYQDVIVWAQTSPAGHRSVAVYTIWHNLPHLAPIKERACSL